MTPGASSTRPYCVVRERTRKKAEAEATAAREEQRIALAGGNTRLSPSGCLLKFNFQPSLLCSTRCIIHHVRLDSHFLSHSASCDVESFALLWALCAGTAASRDGQSEGVRVGG
jgi:hypothetical protein